MYSKDIQVLPQTSNSQIKVQHILMYKQTHEWSKIHFWLDKIDSATTKWSYVYKVVSVNFP